VVRKIAPGSGADIWALNLGLERKSEPFLQTPFNETAAAFSPNGRWVAYVSNESGRNQVYVQPYPGPRAKTQVSTEGGTEPVWARNVRELFYRNDDEMISVDVTTQSGFTVGKSKVVFEGQYHGGYDVTADGQRFLMIKGSEQESAATEIIVVQEWFVGQRPRTGGER
jgi:Tol biopolymer transport system component